MICVGLFIYPEARDYQYRWSALRGARKIALEINRLRTQAIIGRKALEMRFIGPAQITIHEVENCGPQAQGKQIAEMQLESFDPNLVFAPTEWVRNEVIPILDDPELTAERVANRYCYDALYGSSLQADGVASTSIYVLHQDSLKKQRPYDTVGIRLSGTNGDVQFF
ncbi:MAG TPA: hypothetical protein PLH57_08825 [Oligoflexia bacterium]|nr:hypothetical protein [Oligoflexia bacterium]